MSKPHIIYIITKLELGGAQKVCLSLFDGLNKTEPTASLISGTRGPLVKEAQGKPSVYLIPELTRKVSLFGFFKEIRAFWKLTRLLKRLKKEHKGKVIVHTHSTKAGMLGRWAAVCAGIKTRVHTVHGYYGFHAHQNPISWCITYVFELITSFITTHYVCTTSHDVAVGIKFLPKFAAKHSIIRPAVNVDHFIPAQQLAQFPSEKPFVFGTVACFKPQKNLFDLLQAFRLVHQHNPHTRLELVGDGALRPAIQDWITAHELDDVITLHGWQDNVAPIMQTWHAFVLSSLWEGICLAIVEARLLKLPVLSYKTGGIHDVITSGENGFLYQQKQWQQLAHGMLALSKNPALHKKLQSYEDDFSAFYTDAMVHEHSALYKTLK